MIGSAISWIVKRHQKTGRLHYTANNFKGERDEIFLFQGLWQLPLPPSLCQEQLKLQTA